MDTISKIIAIRDRSPGETRRLKSFYNRLTTIGRLVQKWSEDDWEDDRIRIEATRYIPIALVAAIEGWMRIAIRDLIDAGEPFATNAKNLKIGKFDYDLVLAIGSQKLTPGEIVAHFTSCSRLEHLIDNLDKILGVKIVPLTKRVEFKSEAIKIPLSEIYDELAAMVAQTFILRHIFAHELDPSEVVESATLMNRIKYSQVLFAAYDRVLENKIQEAGTMP